MLVEPEGEPPPLIHAKASHRLTACDAFAWIRRTRGASRRSSVIAAIAAVPRPWEALLVCLQLAALAALNWVGNAITHALGISFPGNLLGMLILLLLLVTGVVKLRWIDRCCDILTHHLAFFFIPIAVGLLAYGELARSEGPAILAVLILSAAIGILLAGGAVAGLLRSGARRP